MEYSEIDLLMRGYEEGHIPIVTVVIAQPSIRVRPEGDIININERVKGEVLKIAGIKGGINKGRYMIRIRWAGDVIMDYIDSLCEGGFPYFGLEGFVFVHKQNPNQLELSFVDKN